MSRPVGAAALLAVAALLWPRGETADVSDAAPAPAAPESPAAPLPTSIPTGNASRQLQLPDGSHVPTLNGASDAAPLAQSWGPGPWSPIVGRERSAAGVEWYRHADGSLTTTEMVWRADLGRAVCVTRVEHPKPDGAAIAPSAARGSR